MNRMGLTPEQLVLSAETTELRRTKQEIMPAVRQGRREPGYDMYPAHPLSQGVIHEGYGSLAEWIAEKKTVIIDGYVGNFWRRIAADLDTELEGLGIRARWIHMDDYVKDESEIDRLIAPYIGEVGDVWGEKAELDLFAFYQQSALRALKPDFAYDVNIVIGPGAALCGWSAPLIYIDLPKNELQHRMHAGSVTNLGDSAPAVPMEMYKRFFFVDWVVCNQHKASLLGQADVIADGQGIHWITWAAAADIRSGIEELAGTAIRPRPWFTPGSWGGQWMKEQFPQLNQEEQNYAWSFELIAPENGLVFEQAGVRLEVSFDCLMFLAGDRILGKHYPVFGHEFPVRFDFLDTFDGGNLSIQCHPSVAYIQEHFGERWTQDETYYMLDSGPDAKVYLGFQDDVDPSEFRQELEDSLAQQREIDVAKYIQTFPANTHDFFLIPNGTIHSSGRDNLVLEISATPYIFTFKLYDWLSLDLEGRPRPINIEHGFANLRFDRKGEKVAKELISKPRMLESGDGWKIIHLPTHAEHYYDVHRIELAREITVDTQQGFHLLMLVEGTEIRVRAGEREHTFHYAETFVIPAGVGQYTITNTGGGEAKIVKAFVKENYGAAT